MQGMIRGNGLRYSGWYDSEFDRKRKTDMTKPKNYKKTQIACYLGFITQAISANFTPLLFLTFKSTYGISLEKSR